MAEENKFTELKSTLIKAKQQQAEDPSKAGDKRDSKGRAYATGRRKESVARVWIKPGTGKITVNGRDETVYFARPVLRMILRQPLIAANRDGQFDVVVSVNGGGLSGQAGAVRHGIAQALAKFEPALRGAMKQNGFLTRDPRVVERKKYGRAGARRRFRVTCAREDDGPCSTSFVASLSGIDRFVAAIVLVGTLPATLRHKRKSGQRNSARRVP